MYNEIVLIMYNLYIYIYYLSILDTNTVRLYGLYVSFVHVQPDM